MKTFFMEKTKKRLRLKIKGSFFYFGTEIYSPERSHIFERFIEDGAFEESVSNAICSFAKPETYLFDVGANIGLISARALHENRRLFAISVECSPSTTPFLEKTIKNSPHSERWGLITVAAGEKTYISQFATAGPDFGAFDGFKDTGRGGDKKVCEVKVDTLDNIWENLGKPRTSFIKIDVEGAENSVLRGAARLIASESPAVVLEWNIENLQAYKTDPMDIFHLVPENYEMYHLETLSRTTKTNIKMQMYRSDAFILIPLQDDAPLR